jgi:hypothetical protein
MRNLEKCPDCLQRFDVEWQGKSSQKGISLILNRLISILDFFHIQGVFEVEVFLLTCDSMRCSKEF